MTPRARRSLPASRREKELSARAVQSAEQAEAFEKDFQKWNDYNEALLTSLFTNDSPKIDYRWSVTAGVIVGEESVYARHRRRLEEIRAKCTELESLAEKLELIPLVPGVDLDSTQGTRPNPEWAWQLLHPQVVRTSRERFDAGHYADSVEAALKRLNNEVKSIAKARGAQEMDGAQLMHTALSPKNPLIVLADLSTQTGKDMQQGYMKLFAGAMSAIRNPKAHDNVVTSDERALHLLFLASTLWYTLDERP
jgi:uncharacterized protein (TIGR02391 family)